MPITKSRQIAKLFKPNGIIKESLYDSDAIVTSAQLGVTADVGTATYSSADTLPASADNGDQALVTSTNRLYIYSNGGWYNIALINSTPYWSTEASSSYNLNTDGTSTTITILAVDSEGINVVYTAVTDSDFDNIATITKDSDNGRTFTITPTDSENGTAIGGTGTITFRASDGVNLVSTLSTFSLTFITIVANSNYTTLLLKADTTGTDNQVDASTNNHTITENGNVTSTTLSPYHPGGYSTYFDGVSDYLSFTMTSAFNLTGDFTLECWFNPNALALDTQHPNIIKMGTYQLYLNSASNFVGISPDGASVTLQSANSSIALNTWYHVAVVRSGSSEAMFLNGTRVDTNTASTVYGASSGTSLIGTYSGTGGDYNGTIRDLRLVNGTAIYDPSETTISTPTEPLTAVANTSLLTCHLPYIADGSSNNHTITSFGNTSTKRFSPYDYSPYTKAEFGGSVYFDGTGDYLSGNDMGLGGAAAFTVEAWMYPTVYNTYANDIYSHGANSSVGADFLAFGLKSDGNVQMFKGSGSPVLLSTSAPCATLNQWYHVAFVRESNNNISAYVNGVLVAGPTSVEGHLTYAPTGRAFIGTQSYSAGAVDRSFEGYMTDVRIVTDAVYTTAFTPPTAPLTAITNTELLTCTNKNDIWDAGNGDLLTKVGNTTASNTQRKFATSSAVYFNGSGDEITTSTSKSFNYGTEDFTWEAWVYVSSQGTYDYVFSQHTLAAGLGLYFQGGVWKLYHANAVQITTSTSVSNNTWYHVALARESGTVRLFVDGTLAGSATITASIPSGTTYGITLGRWTEVADSQYFHGYMQDVRITKGLARYTATFTPPTAEFDG
jgi:hypothetical protein